MKLIVGLGNPGKEYSLSRHNTGWQVVAELGRILDFDDFKKETKFKANITRGEIKGEKIILAQPLTYMNLSGEAVSAIMKFYKLEPDDLWVIYDDVDLPLGQIRIRKDGGPGTHNGMKSIVEKIGDNSFPRFRVGIESRGVTAHKEQETADFVLSPFNENELNTANIAFKKAVQAILTALNKNLDLAMNEYNI
jgi:peptidyl-tRNA hydrolase, PTH1 family